jgi:hypothetical protein
MQMLSIEDNVSKLKISKTLVKKLEEKDKKKIGDIWILKRKDLKNLGFNDREIKSIIISLQLEGLDLNKKIYD